MAIDAMIAHTYIGREYQWDRLSEVDPDLLHNNRESAMRVLNNPGDSPNANFAACNQKVIEIDAFFAEHGPILDQFS